MKLTAMMIVRNEADRYLKWVLPSLNEFCDEIRVVDDDSTDGTHSILNEHGCVVMRKSKPSFFEHEGRARNELLDWTLSGNPTHILAIDGDELIGDGQFIRQRAQAGTASGVWNLQMEEVWKADSQYLYERVDGQWGSRKVPILFEVPARMPGNWRIANRALACGREPTPVAKAGMRSKSATVGSVFHLGWACESDRAERYARYVKYDGGEFHASAHLQSIMFDDSRVNLSPRPWPEGMFSSELLDRINR